MSLARVQHLPALGAPGGEQSLIRHDRPPQLTHVVAQHFPKATGLKKIPLHVDDQQRNGGRRKFKRIGLGGDGDQGGC